MKKNEIKRNTADLHKWENYSKQLDVEYRQSLEEGKDIESLKPLFDAVAALPDSEYKDTISDAVFGMVCDAPIKAGYPYEEPSDIEGIRRLRKGAEEELALPEDGLVFLRSGKLKKQKRRTSGISTGYGKTGKIVCCLTYLLSTVRIRTAPGRFSDHSDCLRTINCSAQHGWNPNNRHCDCIPSHGVIS